MDYQLTQTGEQTQNLLDKVPTIETNLNAEILRSTNKDEELETAIGNEKTRAEGAEGALETAIGNEKTRAEGAEGVLAGDISANTTAIGNEKTRAEGAEGVLQQNIEAEATARDNADDALQAEIDGIDAKIPVAASSSNQLADKAFVNSSIATNTADFKGTYNSLEQLEQVSANANDYGFVVATDAAGNTVYNRYKYVAGTGWMFEYALNNSSFTSEQWAAIQSGITALLVAKLADLPTVAQLTTQLNQIIASVTAEKTRAENAEDALGASIAANTTAIGAEKTRAEGAEAVLREDIADNALAIAAEKTRAEGAEGTLQTAVNNEKARAEGAELTLQQNINAEATLRNNADDTLQANIDAINAKIPSAASSSNQLADKAFVNSSISTNTAEFKGTYNSLAELQAVTGANANDYGFVIATDAAGNTVYNRYKYVEGTGWVFEYALNNSSFTSEQWAAIQSGITALLVSKLSGLPDIDGLNAMFAAITSLIPSAATSSNKLVDYAQMVAALSTKQNTLTFDNAPTAGSDNPVKSQGILAAINAAIAPLATQSDLNTLAGRVTTAEGRITTAESNITSLDGRISTNEADIAALQALYNALQQSAPQVIEPTDTWPVANPSATVIYRVIDRVNTPPEYYSDYMWNGTSFVLMATYDNAIDDVPTAGSNNLVKSGGVAGSLNEIKSIVGVQDITPNGGENKGVIHNNVIHLNAGNISDSFNISLTGGKHYCIYVGGDSEVYNLTTLVLQVKNSNSTVVLYKKIVFQSENTNLYKSFNSLYNLSELDVENSGNYTVLVTKNGNPIDLRFIISEATVIESVKKQFIGQVKTATQDYAIGLEWLNAASNGSNNFIYSAKYISAEIKERGNFAFNWDSSKYELFYRTDDGLVQLNCNSVVRLPSTLTKVTIGLHSISDADLSLSDVADFKLSIKRIDVDNEIDAMLENGAFNGSGNDVTYNKSIRTKKIPCDVTECIIAICPDDLTMYCNLENEFIPSRYNVEGISNGISLTAAHDFVRFGFIRNDGSDFNMENITEAERNGIHIYKIRKSSSLYDVRIGMADSPNIDCADIICSDDNVQYILNAATSCLGNISIQLLGGTYNMSKVFSTKYGVKCCLKTQEYVLSKSNRVVLSGDIANMPNIRMTQACFEAMPNDAESALLLVPCVNADNISTANNPRTVVHINTVMVRLYNYTKPIVAVDLTFAGEAMVKDCYIRGDYNTGTETFTTMPDEGCVGLRVGHGSNNGIGNAVKHTIIWYFGKGVSCGGEHFVFEDVLTHHCYIGWAFGDRKTGGHFEHPNMMIGCSIEGCYRLMLLTKMAETEEGEFVPEGGAANMYRSTLTCIGLSTELHWGIPLDEIVEGQPTTTVTLPILEVLKGAYRGRVEMDGFANNKPFEQGSGRAFKWINYYDSTTTIGHGDTVTESFGNS